MIILPYSFLLVFLEGLLAYLHFSYGKMKSEIIELILCLKVHHLENEINAINQLLKQLENDQSDFMRQYDFNIHAIDQRLYQHHQSQKQEQ